MLAGDKSEANLGLDAVIWERLAETVDLIVDPAALVNHMLPYRQLFGPNVVGTAELIKLALSIRRSRSHSYRRSVSAQRYLSASSTKTPMFVVSAKSGGWTTITRPGMPPASGPAKCCSDRHTTCVGSRSPSSAAT